MFNMMVLVSGLSKTIHIAIVKYQWGCIYTVPCTPNLNWHASTNLGMCTWVQTGAPMLTQLCLGHTWLHPGQMSRHYRNPTRLVSPGGPLVYPCAPHHSQNHRHYMMLAHCYQMCARINEIH